MNMRTSDEYWPMLDDGGRGDGKGLPPWLVFLMLALGAWMLARALAM